MRYTTNPSFGNRALARGVARVFGQTEQDLIPLYRGMLHPIVPSQSFSVVNVM